MTTRRKGLVFIPGETHLARFVKHSAFDGLAREHDITLVIPARNGQADFILGENAIPAITLNVDPGRQEIWEFLFTLSAFAFISRSRTFAIRMRGLYSGWWPSRKLLAAGPRGLVRYCWRALRLLLRQPRYWGFRVLALPPIYNHLVRRRIDALGVDAATIDLLTRERPDFIVIPSSIHDIFSHDVVMAAQALAIPTMMMQGNWDNIASKGVMFHYPDRLAVWGEQSRQDAIHVQRIPEDRTRIIGAAQFESFRDPPALSREEFLANAGLPADRPMIVFAGNARGFDEISALLALEDAITGERLPPMSVIYRPHPWSSKPDVDLFQTMTWRHIVLDPETAESLVSAKNRHQAGAASNFYYSFDYLNTMYSHCSAMVVPYSTAILECMIKGVPVVCIAYSDGNSHWGPHITAQMSHCQDLFGKAGVFRCDDERNLVPMVQNAVTLHGSPEGRDAVRAAARYFVDFSDRPYCDRLVDLVNGMLCGE